LRVGTLGELVEAAIKSELFKALDAAQSAPLDRIDRRSVEPVLRRIVPCDATVTPVEVAAFGSKI
jgi:hypothetical protein